MNFLGSAKQNPFGEQTILGNPSKQGTLGTPSIPIPRTWDPPPKKKKKSLGNWEPLFHTRNTKHTSPPRCFSVHILISRYGVILSKVDSYYIYPYFSVLKNVPVFQLPIFFNFENYTHINRHIFANGSFLF